MYLELVVNFLKKYDISLSKIFFIFLYSKSIKSVNKANLSFQYSAFILNNPVSNLLEVRSIEKE